MNHLLGSGFYAQVYQSRQAGKLVIHKCYFASPFAPLLCVQECHSWLLLNPYLGSLNLGEQQPARQSPLSWSGVMLSGQPMGWQSYLNEPWQRFLSAWFATEPKPARLSLRQQLASCWPIAKLALGTLPKGLADYMQSALLSGMARADDQPRWDWLTHGDLHWQNLLWQEQSLSALIDPWQSGFRHSVWEQAMMLQPQALQWWQASDNLRPQPFEWLWLARVLMDLQHLFYVPNWSSEEYFKSLCSVHQSGDWLAWSLVEPVC